MNGEDILACAMRQGLDAESGHTCSRALSLSLSLSLKPRLEYRFPRITKIVIVI